MRVPSSPWLISGLALWLLGASAAMGALQQYKLTPGARGETPATWPESSMLPRTPGHATAVLFVHPRCPCTRASLKGFRQVVSRSDGHTDLLVLFMVPPSPDSEWTGSDTWREVGTLTGVERIVDVSGAVARSFGAQTSGHVVFYDEMGVLRFSGGITPARGHEGDNAGLTSLSALVAGRSMTAAESPVFGCALHDPQGAMAP